MATSTIVLIVVVAVVALLLIAGLAWFARTKRDQHRHVEARDQLNEQWDRANELDPASQTPDTPDSADHSQPQPAK